MTDIFKPSAVSSPSLAALIRPLFAGAVFASASLVFLVEPMLAKLVLPSLGGSPAVWNTCLCFFQAMLLIGYGYAHLLQRISSVRTQAIVHACVLIAAALVLPLRVSDMMGAPDANAPVLWLLGVLTLSIGLPFAALSATAPLVQSWYARARAGKPDGANPYVLYAASNLGSLLALLAYPILVEPSLSLHMQTLSWSLGFVLFAVLMGAVALVAARAPSGPMIAAPKATATTPWRERLIWIGLGAVPSSLMIGVTTYITTDVASAPFLWIAPLALYLITFIIAFQDKPWISQQNALLFQAPLLALCVTTIVAPIPFFPAQMALHLAGFFLTALVCHHALAARRPEPARLTEFYLLMSVGGVLGGVFNALIAPAIFNSVLEYTLVLVLACLARPWGEGPLQRNQIITFALGAGAAVLMLALAQFMGFNLIARLCLAGAMVAAFLLRDTARLFFALIASIAVLSPLLSSHENVLSSERSFFGVLRVMHMDVPDIGPARRMAHGTTLHGAQGVAPEWRCRPLVYYAPTTPIGQTFQTMQARQPALNIGAIGMGAGTVAAYTRAGDRLRFFEIDPLVVRTASDPAQFSYVNGCAQGHVDTVIGDARLNLVNEPAHGFDLLLVDAFSSDSIPAHLLTVEAIQLYLDRIKPDGVIVMHLTNRHLELIEPVAETVRAAGGAVLLQRHRPQGGNPIVDAPEDAMVIARDPRVLEAFRADPRWIEPPETATRIWTDDYVNLFGALVRGLQRGEDH